MSDYEIDTVEFSNRAHSLMIDGIELTDLFVNRSYMINLDKCEPVPIAKEDCSFTYLTFFEIDKIVYDESENLNDRLISVYSALSNFGSSAILVIAGNSDGVKFYLGSRDVKSPFIAKTILSKSLRGNFPGIKLKEIQSVQVEKIMSCSIPENYTGLSVSSVSIVPSKRKSESNHFIQGIEKFIDSMAGEKYTAVVITRPIQKDELESRKKAYEDLYSTLSQCEQINLTYSENQSESIANSLSESFVDSVTSGVAETVSNGNAKSLNRGNSNNYGSGFGFFGVGVNSSHGVHRGYSTTNSYAKSVSDTSSDTHSTGNTSTDSTTSTQGSSATFSLCKKNKTVKSLMEKIDEQLNRIRDCESYGLWDTACYFISEEREICLVAANTFRALVSGDNSSVDSSFINLWDGEFENFPNTMCVLDYLRYGVHPCFKYKQTNNIGEITESIVSPASLVSCAELPVLMGLPHKSVNGLVSISSAEFGRNVYTDVAVAKYRNITIGSIYHMGEILKDNRVKLDLDSLCSHCFITGSTGSGKSNTVYKIIEELLLTRNGIPFLVIEPAKGEYKREFAKLPGINIFTTNPKYNNMLSINPFEFQKDVHVLEHLDRLIEIFSACWPLYAAMPALLKSSFEEAYIKHGWDLYHSIHIDKGNGIFPTFDDVIEILPRLLENSDFSAQTKGDYVGSLVTRVQSLTNGLIGQIFNGYSIQDDVLFDRNAIVDISRIGSTETKALITGILILKLNEYRQSNSVGVNNPLKHVTILEEAHNLLKRTSTHQGQESSNVQGKSVEMISNSIAEMRTYGEGFIIIDQSPTSVDISAIKNTNTKIIMRLPEKDDREDVGASVGLNENQIIELSRLSKGVGIIYQNDWIEAVQVKIDQCESKYKSDSLVINDETERIKLVGNLLDELIMQDLRGYFVLSRIIKIISASRVNEFIKKKYSNLLYDYNRDFHSYLKQKAFSKLIFDLLECDHLLKVFEDSIPSKRCLSDIPKELLDATSKWCDAVYKELDRYALFSSKKVKDICFMSILFYMYDTESIYEEKYKFLVQSVYLLNK